MRSFHLLAVTAAVLVATTAPAAAPRTIVPFDSDWRFHLGDDPAAIQPAFADATWAAVNVPHDWSIAGPFDPHAPAGGAGAFLPTGIGWYRKHFTLPASDRGRQVVAEFDGVMQNSDVWINGAHLGHRPYGYVSFRYDLTPHLRFDGADNVLVVRADTSQQPASRWYAGSGIYRHVRLVVTDPVHLAGWSTFVTTPEVSDATATVRIEAVAVNGSSAARPLALRVRLLDPAGRVAADARSAAQPAPAGQSVPLALTLAVPHPQRWDVTAPNLYRAEVSLVGDDRMLDTEDVSFGIRTAEFDSRRGFLLNGRVVRIYGAAVHHEGGAFGAAVPLAVWEQRLNGLRSVGVNAIRTAHNPPDPGFLDLCDRMGFLVMDELFDCWTVGKNPYDYHVYFQEWSKTDVRDTVRRDRNHPSIILYSAGNEIHDTPQEELAKNILAGLVATFHENDPTRPVTQALFRPNASHDYTNGLADLLDVIGTNYRDPELLAAWAAKPGRKIIGTEQRQDRDTWVKLRDHPEEAGQFLWAGVDYLGESRRWPTMTDGAGLEDRTGALKPVAGQRASWWTDQPMVKITRRVAPDAAPIYDPGYEPGDGADRRQVIFADWTPSNAKPHSEQIEVYSNADSVELFLNDRSLGAQPIHANAAPRIWRVTFEPGTLRAVARNQGKAVATDELRTAGPPARLVLRADRNTASPSWDDVVRVVATVVDANGIRVPAAKPELSFSTEGPGTVVATDNGDLTSHESFQAPHHHASQGTCVAWIRATAASGRIIVHATADGLESGDVELTARASKPRR